MLTNLIKFLDPSSLGTGMTGEGSYLDDGRRGYFDPGGCNYCA
ncbi:MAG: hypothetical protein ACEY3M_13795 [Wolbachia sp.]